MFEKFIQAIRDLAYFSEQARRNNDELKDLRRKHEETALAVQRLAFEIQRLKENEAHEREKQMLRLELKGKPSQKQPVKKQLPKKSSR